MSVRKGDQAEGKLQVTKGSLTAFIANAKRGNTYRIQQDMVAYYENMTGGRYDDQQRKVA